MTYEVEDRLRDLERELREFSSQLGRLPIRQATAEISEGDLVIGQATTSVSSGTSTFSIDNIRCIEGTDPRTDPESASETLSVKNTLGLALENNQLVYARRNKEGDWDTWADTKGDEGGEGSGGVEHIRFELLSDFTRETVAGTAVIIDSLTGEVADAAYWAAGEAVLTGDRRRAPAAVGGFAIGQIITSDSDRTTGADPPGFDVSEAEHWSSAEDYIYVLDPTKTFSGHTTVEEEHAPWRGFAYKLTDDYNSSGKPGYIIIHIEGLRGLGEWENDSAIKFLASESDIPLWIDPDNAEPGYNQLLGRTAGNTLRWYTGIECNPPG